MHKLHQTIVRSHCKNIHLCYFSKLSCGHLPLIDNFMIYSSKYDPSFAELNGKLASAKNT